MTSASSAFVPSPVAVTPQLLAQHSITADEYSRILAALGRVPSLTELGIYSVMWSEHCSYKSSRVHLKRLPTKSDRVVQGPGENAGIIDVGDGWACAFKIESHNHPSYIEPFQGAATGVGGILRDIFTMGARPLAVMDSLRFGPIEPNSSEPGQVHRNHSIVEGVVSLTQAFHREVIAEGVESGEHGLVLLQLGCDYGQGFGIARPMPGGDIPDWTRSWKPDPRWSEPHALMLRREDFPLLAMEMEHRNWVAGIAAFLRGGGAAEPPPPLDPRSCRFGRWYQTGGRERYGHMKSFAAMNSLHEQVHLLARELMDLAKAGNRADAVARLDELNGRRDAFLAGLDHLKRTIAAGYAAAPTLFS